MKVQSIFLCEGGALDGNVLRGVIVCARHSRNDNEYTDAALRGLVKVYEGRGVYCDHQLDAKKGRKLEERFGHLEGCHFVANEHVVRADLPFLASHPMAERIREAYQAGRPYFGLSHHGSGKGQIKGKKRIIEEVTHVDSIDLVDGAA